MEHVKRKKGPHFQLGLKGEITRKRFRRMVDQVFSQVNDSEVLIGPAHSKKKGIKARQSHR